MECKKCGATEHSKNGFIKGHQRYKCKNCAYQFVPTLQKGFDEQTKLIACLLSFIVKISVPFVIKLLFSSFCKFKFNYLQIPFNETKEMSF